jgi:NADPH:quinone reductase-like Zn-dependent oxidoreductase
MKTIQFTGYGGPEKLRLVDKPIPTPSAQQLQIRVSATSINPIDWKLHSGMLRWVKPLRFPSTPCFDFAGTVTDTGADVMDWTAGDRVFGMLPINGLGAAAEYVAVDSHYACRMPEELSFENMAGLPLAGMTALQGLRDQGELKPGHTLLVIGAAGGVGHYALQMGRLLGAQVTTLSGPGNLAFCRELGAETALDYNQANPSLAKADFDVILDCSGHSPFSRWQHALAPRGRYVALLPSVSVGLAALRLRLFSSQRIRLTLVRSHQDDLAWLANEVSAGRLKTVIDEVFPLERLADALKKSQGGHARGKIIVSLS